MKCIFCKIIRERSTKIIYEDKLIIAFNDIRPCAPIHQLVLPKKHISTLNDMTEEEVLLLGHMQKTSVYLAKKANIGRSGYRVVINCNAAGGQEIFHLHLHLIGGRNLGWPPG